MAFDQSAVSSFLEVVAGESSKTAVQYLEATGWRVDDAVELFYAVCPIWGSRPPESSSSPGEDDGFSESSIQPHDEEDELSYQSQIGPIGWDDGDIPPQDEATTLRHYRESLPPSLPVDPTSQNFEESDQETNTISNDSHDNVSSHPNNFMYYGTFHRAKKEASLQNKWLLVNVQPAGEVIVWVKDSVEQTIQSNFLFWQVTGESEEGKKVACFYNLISLPVLVMIDPVTGMKMRAWSNMIEAERLLEDLLPFLDSGPQDAITNTAVKKTCMVHGKSKLTHTDELISEKEEDDDKEEIVVVEKFGTIGMNKYPALGEEPTCERGLVCRVAVRLPNGKRILRSFLREDPIKLLWSFCTSLLEEGLTRPFHFAMAIPGVTRKQLEYSSSLSFEEACLSNSMLTLVWDQQLH